jgi:hypothetical protein
MFTLFRLLLVPWARLIPSVLYDPIGLEPSLMLSSHLCPCLASGLFAEVFSARTQYLTF